MFRTTAEARRTVCLTVSSILAWGLLLSLFVHYHMEGFSAKAISSASRNPHSTTTYIYLAKERPFKALQHLGFAIGQYHTIGSDSSSSRHKQENKHTSIAMGSNDSNSSGTMESILQLPTVTAAVASNNTT